MNKFHLFLIFTISFKLFAKDHLNIRQFIDVYQKNDPEHLLIENKKNRLKFYIDEALPTDKTTISLNNEKGFNAQSDQNTNISSGEVSKDFLVSGTSVSLTQSNATRPDRTEDLKQIRIEQSLYKNMFGRDLRLKKNNLIKDEEIKQLEIIEEYEQYITKVLNNYLQLDKAKRDFELAQKIYQEAIVLDQSVKEKFKSKIATVTDNKRSQLLVLLRKEEMLLKQNIYLNILAQVEQIVKMDSVEFNPEATNNLIDLFKKEVKDIKSIDIESLRPFLIAKGKLLIAQADLELTQRLNQADLNLILGYNKDNSTRFGSLSQRDETVVGVRLEIPLGDSKAQAQTEISRVDLLKTEILHKKNYLDFEQKVQLLQVQLKERQDQFVIDLEKVNLMKSILNDEEKRFMIGKIDLEKLIEAKNSYATYRSQQENSKFKYAQVLIYWLALTDNLLNTI